MSPDERLKKEIEAQLFADSRINRKNISIEVLNGGVVLKGAVSSYAAFEAVGIALKNIKNITCLKNEIKIRYDGELLPDSIVSSNINKKLNLDRNIDPGKITTSVEQGVVTLRGSVRSYWGKVYCEEVLKTVDGVIQIINDLAVVNTGNSTDSQIANQIIEALQRIDDVDIEEVTIFVENGVVSLTGKVPNWNAYYAAEYAARNTRGVLDIKNQLLLSY